MDPITINIAKYPSSPISMVSIVCNVYKITIAQAIQNIEITKKKAHKNKK